MIVSSRNLLQRVAYQRRHSGPAYNRFASTLTLGIRREDPRRTWERRCPLSPSAVAQLVAMGIDVQVQHCNRRVWTHDEFRKAGASIVNDVSNADIVVGIKEVPIQELSTSSLREQTQFMFSHTHKGQSYNMDLLSLLIRRTRLVDYELLTDRAGPEGKRTIAFGWYAGAVGLVEGLCAYGRYLLTLGIATPMLHLPRPYMNPSLHEMKESLKTLGQRIHEEGIPKEAGPLVIAVTGAGQVASGALDMLKELSAMEAQPSELLKLVEEGGADLRKAYVVHVPAKEYLERKDGGRYDRANYYSNPSDYRSALHQLIAPYVSLMVNGAGWHPGFPRLMDNSQLVEALQAAWTIGPGRLGTISDVTCDLEGGLEFVSRASTIDEPFVKVKPPGSPSDHPGMHIVSVDILPTELPKDASLHFSNAFLPYIQAFVKRQLQLPFLDGDKSKLDAVDRATIAQGGKLLPPHEWLGTHLSSESSLQAGPRQGASHKKKVLLFGSGMVAKPVVDTLARRSDITVIIAGNDMQQAALLAKEQPNVELVAADASNKNELNALISKVDVVISLLPASMHPSVAEVCIDQGVHLVTASYTSPAMQSLHSKAIARDVLLLNECGLDPGIDHCAAVDLIHRVQSSGREVKSFISFCGGMPAPENSNVPLSYKFSWSPRAVLTAAKNAALFKLEDQVMRISGDKLLQQYFRDVPLFPGFSLEGLANRNSFDYVAPYGLNGIDSLTTQLRGTLRYKGFARLLSIFQRLGLLEETGSLSLDAWSSFLDRCLENIVGVPIRDDLSRGAAMTDILGDHWAHAETDMEWLGLLPSTAMSEQGYYPALPSKSVAPLDLLSILLNHRLRYHPGERDIVILGHEVVADERGSSVADPSVHTSLLVVYGDERSSAMARTVGLPVAFAALRVLDHTIATRGVTGPTRPEIYPSMLTDLAGAGIAFKETVHNAASLGPALRSSWTGR